MTILFANNDLSTLAGSINNVALTATLAAGTGGKFPNPTGGDYFMLTFRDLATGLLNEIVKVTARVGDVVTIVRAQEGTTAQAWSAGDLADGLITAGGLAAMMQQSNNRIRLAAATSFYVDTAGSDVTGDGTNGNPWLTMQHAVNVVQQGYDLNGFVCSFLRKGGAYTDATIVTGRFVGQTGRSSVIFGQTGGAVTVSSVASCYAGQDGAAFTVQNQGLASSAGFGVIAVASTISHGGNNFGVCASAHRCATDGGFLVAIAPSTISGNAQNSILASVNGSVSNGVADVVSGTPAFAAAFAAAQQNGTINAAGYSFSGAGATGSRYLANTNGVIDTNGGGATFFPGNAAGAVATGGQYN